MSFLPCPPERQQEALLVDLIELAIDLLRCAMNPELTEEEMPHALLGNAPHEVQVTTPAAQGPVPKVVFTKPEAARAPKKKVAQAFRPRLRVTLRAGNEFEGKTY